MICYKAEIAVREKGLECFLIHAYVRDVGCDTISYPPMYSGGTVLRYSES